MLIQRRKSDATKGICLGIDQSYSGFAIVQLDANDVLAPVVRKFPGKKDWSTAQKLLRIFDIEDFLTGVCTAWQGLQIDAICMEGYARGVINGREESGELAITVRKALFEHLGRVPCVVGPTQVKKFACGSGTAKKDDMKLAVYKRWGLETKDDNIADAASLAKIARALCDGGTGLIGAQQEVLKALAGDESWRLNRTELLALQR